MQVVVQSYGALLRVNNGMFEVVHKDGKQAIPYDKVTSFLIAKGVSITSDAILAAIEQSIEILFTDRKGFPLGRIWSNRFGSVSSIRKAQLQFASDIKGTELVISILNDKMLAQQAMVLCLSKPDRSTDGEIKRAYDRIEKYRSKLENFLNYLPADAGPSLRGFEGNASRIYWETISLHLPEQYRFEKRSQHPAEDMFNCLLNYAYGILYGKIESAMITAGIDPSIGIHHRDEYNRPVFVYDVIEKYRAWADNVVISLCMQEVIFIEFFEIENNGFWLTTEGKRILIQAMNDYLSEVITLNGLSRSRLTHIGLWMQQLATKLADNGV